jgi:twitching motility protein PilT
VAQLDRLFRDLLKRGASDLHLAVGLPPRMRVHGDLEVVREAALRDEEARACFPELVTREQWERVAGGSDLDFAYGVPGVVRLRGNYFHQRGGLAAVFRVIPERVRSAEELGLPAAVQKMAAHERGLVLVTGPTGSGKSSTLAAMIDAINRGAEKHIVTIEEPLEFLHQDQRSVVLQREVGTHTQGFARALRAAVREDPDVILVGELRDRETMALALKAAEMGFLVFGTLHTNGAARAVDRVIDLFPAGEQGAVRQSLAAALRGVVSQLLLRSADGRGRVAIHEVLVGSGAISAAIREGSTSKLYSMMQAGRGQGMQTMDQGLLEAVQAGRIAGEEAWRKAQDKGAFERFVRG